MMDESYKSARKAKLLELKKLMHELIAEEGDEPMEDGQMEEVLAQADGAVAEDMEMEETDDDSELDEDEEEYDPLMTSMRDYFKPKKKPARPGTATLLAIGESKPMSSGYSGKLQGKRKGMMG